MVFLEAKPLHELPWEELFNGSVLLLVCRQVATELDQKKQDGRLGVRARAMIRLLDKFIETSVPVRVSSSPDVDIALVENTRVVWSDFDDLDPMSADDRIVAQALSARIDNPTRIMLLSYDIRPRHAASTNGLRAVKLPERWLRDPEQSPHEKRVAELERKVKLLSADQPELEVAIEVLSPQPWRFRDVSPPSSEQLTELLSELRAEREERQTDSPFAVVTVGHDYTYPARFSMWRKNAEKNLPLINSGLSRYLSQQRLKVRLRNTGVVPAEHVSLEISSGNCVLHEVPFIVLVTGGGPPKPRSPFDTSLSYMRRSFAESREKFNFYCDESGPGSQVVYSCDLFRQGQSQEIEVTVELHSRSSPTAHIMASASATNMKERSESAAIVDVSVAETGFLDAFDLETRRPRVPSYFDMRWDVIRGQQLFHNDGSSDV